MRRIYLDTAAGTELDKRVRKVYQAALKLGNPSSIHAEGVLASAKLEEARSSVATNLKVRAEEIIFTSGGTESNNLAVLGVARAYEAAQGKPGHIIVSAIEHSSVLEPARALERAGWRVTYLAVDGDGLLSLEQLKNSLQPDTALVSIMYANNEIGVIQPLADLRRVVDRYRKEQQTAWPYFHTDACQATRFLPLDIPKLGVDLLTANAAKIYGPKGSGILYKRKAVPLEPIMYGGGQENAWRPGTELVAAAAGLAKALDICEAKRDEEAKRLTELRDYFIRQLLDLIPDTQLNGSASARLPNNINILISGVSAEWLVLALDAEGVACSTGSACSFNTKDESYVIIALGRTISEAESSIRFTLDRRTSRRQLDYVAKKLGRLTSQARAAV